MNSRILFVDDCRNVLESIQRMLRNESHRWEMTFLDDPQEAWAVLQTSCFDAVVSDVSMPLLSGLDLLDRIKTTEATQDIPVVMLTGLEDQKLKRQALDRGAADLLGKPVEPADLVARIGNVLRIKTYEDQLRNQNAWLERMVQDRTRELERSRLEVIWRLGKAADYRDDETGNHIVRVGCMSRAIAETLGMESRFVETLFVAAPLHDIGKIGIPDAVLRKDGPYSDAERQVMMRHCRIGEQILKGNSHAERFLPQSFRDQATGASPNGTNPLIEMGAAIALTHHEKWDGTGYPQGLAGEEIPIEGRITAIADVFDALTSRRPYKPAFDESKSVSIIENSVGTHFDPEIHRAFQLALPELRTIRAQLQNHLNDPESELHGHASNPLCR